jgi:diguanylate cyclase (GGDEF)-like protein/excisionase family DNA binding protein
MPSYEPGMTQADIPRDVRERTAAAIHERQAGLTEDVALLLAGGSGLSSAMWREFGQVVVSLLADAVEQGEIDHRSGALHDLSRFSPPLSTRQLIHAVHRVERVVLDEVALHDRLGATSEVWPIVAHSLRGAMLEIIAAHVEHDRVRPPPGPLMDSLTTLFTPAVFRLALEQEILRSQRHQHGIAMILFDIDDLSQLNHSHGYGAGDRLLERLGILARRYFRTHDWVARHSGDSIAVLLPEATLDQAATLANRFRLMVQQRLVLVDHKTDTTTSVTVSASAVGTDHVQSEIGPGYVMAEAEAAVLRAKMNGGNRVERVALLPTSVTIVGAATLLGTSARAVVRLIRAGALRSVRRGRHYHIDRAQIEEYKRTAKG